MNEFKNSIHEYSESEFLSFVKKIFNVENTSESEDIKRMLHFNKIVQHPDGANLILDPTIKLDDESPEGIINELKRWYAEQGLPLFKES